MFSIFSLVLGPAAWPQCWQLWWHWWQTPGYQGQLQHTLPQLVWPPHTGVSVLIWTICQDVSQLTGAILSSPPSLSLARQNEYREVLWLEMFLQFVFKSDLKGISNIQYPANLNLYLGDKTVSTIVLWFHFLCPWYCAIRAMVCEWSWALQIEKVPANVAFNICMILIN